MRANGFCANYSAKHKPITLYIYICMHICLYVKRATPLPIHPLDVECQSPITAHSTWHTNRYSILVRLTKACLCLPRKPKVFLLCVIDCRSEGGTHLSALSEKGLDRVVQTWIGNTNLTFLEVFLIS